VFIFYKQILCLNFIIVINLMLIFIVNAVILQFKCIACFIIIATR